MTGLIEGRPEGREGIWLISADTACALVDAVEGDMVHCFLESPFAMLGADWEKEEVQELLCKEGVRIGLVFPPNHFTKHQLMVLNDKRRAFNVGEIPESRMVSVEAAV